jgi:hypothetical protein
MKSPSCFDSTPEIFWLSVPSTACRWLCSSRTRAIASGCRHTCMSAVHELLSSADQRKHDVQQRTYEMTASCLKLLTSATLAPRRAASVRNVSLCILGEAVRADAIAAHTNVRQPFRASNAHRIFPVLLQLSLALLHRVLACCLTPGCC